MAKILIVDDEAYVSTQLEERLISMGYDVVGRASSGETSIGIAKSLHPDLILMDIVMPGRLDGIAAAETIKEKLDIPVIFLTGYAEDQFIERAKNVEPFGYIVKPFQEKELKASIEIGLYKHKMSQNLKNSREQLHNHLAHLESAREQEKTFIACEILEDLGQALTGLKMDLSWMAKKILKDQKPLLDKLHSTSELTDTALRAVQRISTELRPGLLDDLGLVAAIEWQAEEFQSRTGMRCKLTVDPEDIEVDEKRSTTLFRIFQETLTNIARHAQATRVTVSLKEKDGTVELRVKDNGKGITTEEISNPQSFGLMGIRERAKPWGGEVKISGRPGKGTMVTVRIPVGRENET